MNNSHNFDTIKSSINHSPPSVAGRNQVSNKSLNVGESHISGVSVVEPTTSVEDINSQENSEDAGKRFLGDSSLQKDSAQSPDTLKSPLEMMNEIDNSIIKLKQQWVSYCSSCQRNPNEIIERTIFIAKAQAKAIKEMCECILEKIEKRKIIWKANNKMIGTETPNLILSILDGIVEELGINKAIEKAKEILKC